MVTLALSFSVQTAEENDKKSEGYTDEEIAEMIKNPLGNLWLMFSQNDTVWYGGDALDDLGESDKAFNTFLINPVMPMQLTENWKYIFRPVIPINSYDIPGNVTIPEAGFPPTGDTEATVTEFNRETGLGDIVLWNAFTTNEMSKPPYIFGAGATVMMDTASDESLGTGKRSSGPMALGMYIDDNWILRGIYQHFWSFEGDSHRDDVNLSDFQYIIRYRLTPETNIGIAPIIRYNWDADTLVKLGPIPTK